MNFSLRSLSPKRREAAAREFLAIASTRGSSDAPPIPEEDRVRVRVLGTIWKGTSALTVRLIRSAKVPLDIRVLIEGVGPKPHELLLDRQHAAKLIAFEVEAQRDFRDLVHALERKPGEVPSERDVEMLRLFGLEAVGDCVAFLASRPKPAEGRG